MPNRTDLEEVNFAMRAQTKTTSRRGRKPTKLIRKATGPNSPHREGSYDRGRLNHAEAAARNASEQYLRIQCIAADLFARKGYRAVGVAEIGENVGLGRGALYYHISSKEELLFGIVIRHIEDLVASGKDAIEKEPDPRKRIYVLSRHLIEVISANISEMTVCFREAECLTGKRHKLVSNLHQAYQDIWTQTLKEGEEKGYFRPLPTVAIKGLLGMYFYSFIWLKPGDRQTATEIADIFANMTLSAIDASNDPF